MICLTLASCAGAPTLSAAPALQVPLRAHEGTVLVVRQGL